MKKNLFNLDIFSNSIAEFKISSDIIVESLKKLILYNYDGIANEIKCVEQVKGNELNSNNYKVTTSSGIYLVKKFICLDKRSNIGKILLLNNWLSDNHVKLGRVYLNNKNEFLVKKDGSYWCIFDFINGAYFSGKSDEEIISVGSEVGIFFKKLESIPLMLYPVDRVGYFFGYDFLMDDMEKHRNMWDVYFKKTLSNTLHENWEYLKNTHSQLVENKELILLNKLVPSYTDLHPHNVLILDNKLKSILDIDSIKIGYNLVSISFSMYKLLRQSIAIRGIRNDNMEISRITKMYFYSLKKEFPMIEKNNLYIYAITEIFRRIFIIFSLNIKKNDNAWNHVLKIHLDGLKEAKIIFDSLNK